ncbi:GNAT family N-acetyltransferase [Methanoculleus sp. Wushi-C6]|uniref:GNAT family N-acetyltransferase n=2 Tax=Methanoculleus caldifontis TaxID=2651577 RepID=A0ABU3X137_9EURY|nr:GNAT family N-acetyltransferase [Methanoculleus sp. Wushi-C6]
MAYAIEPLSESNAHRWEGFITRSPEGTPFHRLKWRDTIEDAMKLKSRYFLILKDGKVAGICPFVEQSMNVFRGLNGIPRSDYNNIVLQESFDPDDVNEVLSLFSKRYSYLFFDTYDPALVEGIEYDNIQNEAGSNMLLDLNHNPPEAIWKDILSKDDRYKVTRFEKGGFTVREVSDGDAIEDFYRYYTENLNHINGYVLPRAYFQRIIDIFSPDEVRVAVLTNNGVFAGGNLALLDPLTKTAYFILLALNRNLPNKYSPTHYLSWEGINWAYENGYERISFGRERPDNPRVRGKQRFGAEPVPVHSRVVLLSKAASRLYRLKKAVQGSGQADEPSRGRVS